MCNIYDILMYAVYTVCGVYSNSILYLMVAYVYVFYMLLILLVDFRFMETMASGALVFVDNMATPRWQHLEHDKHVVYYGK